MDKGWPVCGADNYAVQVVPNVKLRMEAQNSLQLLCSHDLFRENFIC